MSEELGIDSYGANSAEGFYKNELNNQSGEVLNTDTVGSPKTVRRYGDHRQKTKMGFERANWKQALRIKEGQSNSHHGGQKVPYCIGVDHFKSYGPGIYLFFLFLKKAMMLFCVLTVVGMLPLLYNYLNGENFNDSLLDFQVFITKSMIGNQKNSQFSSESRKDKLIIAIPDVICTIAFIVFYFYWERLRKREEQELKKSIKYPSDYTIEVKEFAEGTNEEKLEQFFSHFGPVKEVAAVRNYSEMISLSKSAYNKSLGIKEHKLTCIAEGGKEDEEWVNKKQEEIDDILGELQKIQNQSEHEIIKFYVVFEREETKNEVLDAFKPYERSCCCRRHSQPAEQCLLDGVVPEVKSCEVQPGGILWENMHITWRSRWVRFLVQTILIVVLIFIGFLLISLLNISSPSISTDSSYAQLEFQEVKNETNSTILLSWCVKNDLSTQEQEAFCEEYMKEYYTKIAITVAISLIIVIFKQLLKILVIAIAKFQRYKTHTELATTIMTNLMVTYICTTVLITFLLQANIFGLSFKRVVKSLVRSKVLIKNAESLPEYSDFDNEWYMDIGYQIWLNWLILAVIPHTFMPFYHFLREKLGMVMGKKQVLQKNVIEWIQGEEFEIEDHYANILMIIFVGFTFSGGIPLIIPISLIGLATRYIYFKFVFIRYCRVPKAYTTSMAKRAEAILPIMLAFHILFSIWMMGVPEIFGKQREGTINEWAEQNENLAKQKFAIFIQKISQSWYLTAILVIFLLILVLKKVVFKLLAKICLKSQKYVEKEGDAPQHEIRDQKDTITHNDRIPNEHNEIKSPQNLKQTQKALTISYKIENNPDYLEILAIMKPTSAKDIIRATIANENTKSRFHGFPDHVKNVQ